MQHFKLSISLDSHSFWKKLLWIFKKKHSQYQVPSSFIEVKDWHSLLRLHLKKNKISDELFNVELLQLLSGVPTYLLKLISPLIIYEQLLPMIYWAKLLKLEKPFKETVTIDGMHWRVPSPYFKDMPLHQYFLLEKRFFELVKSEVEIPHFLAALLRPNTKQIESDLYDKGLLPVASIPQLEAYETLLKNVDQETQLYLVQYYATQRELIRQKYTDLHKTDESKKDEVKQIDWDSIIPMIAETKVFGSFSSVLSTPTVSYLAWANARQKEQEPKTKSIQDIIKENHNRMLN